MSGYRNGGLAIIGILVFALLSGAWLLFENSSGRIPQNLSELAYGMLYPGWLVSIAFLGNMHARFGDWRDFVVIVSISWLVWMIPIALFYCRVLKPLREKKKA